MKEVIISMPDITVQCPECCAETVIDGNECEDSHVAFAKCIGYCEACDIEFKVYVGGDL